MKHHSLTNAFLLLFARSLAGQWLAGWHVVVEDAARHGMPSTSLAAYTVSPDSETG